MNFESEIKYLNLNLKIMSCTSIINMYHRPEVVYHHTYTVYLAIYTEITSRQIQVLLDKFKCFSTNSFFDNNLHGRAALSLIS